MERLVENTSRGGSRAVAAPVVHTALRNVESAPKRGGIGGRKPVRKDLSDLLGPPQRLLTLGRWLDVREKANASKRWLLVNIQNFEDFECHTLNRDVWRDGIVEDLVGTHFLLWQVDKLVQVVGQAQKTKENMEAKEWMERYKVNPTAFPLIALIDPRCGELVWEHTGSIKVDDVKRRLQEWVSDHTWGENRAIKVVKTGESAIKVSANSRERQARNIDYGNDNDSDLMVEMINDKLNASGKRQRSESLVDTGAGVGVVGSIVVPSKVNHGVSGEREVIVSVDDDEMYDFVYESDGCEILEDSTVKRPKIGVTPETTLPQSSSIKPPIPSNSSRMIATSSISNLKRGFAETLPSNTTNLHSNLIDRAPTSEWDAMIPLPSCLKSSVPSVNISLPATPPLSTAPSAPIRSAEEIGTACVGTGVTQALKAVAGTFMWSAAMQDDIASTTPIVVRMSEKRFTRLFYTSQSVLLVYAWVCKILEKEERSCSMMPWDLLHGFPPRSLANSLTLSISDAGLCKAVVICKRG